MTELTKYIVMIHLVFTHCQDGCLNRHVDVPWTYNPLHGYTFEDECTRDAEAYNVQYGGLGERRDGVIEHAFCKPIRVVAND